MKPDRILDPLNDQSPLFGALTPGARVRITAMLPAGQRVAGSGFIDTAEYDVASAQGRIRAVDGVGMLAQAQIAEGVTLPDTLRARVRAVVAAVGLDEIITVEDDRPEMGPDPPVAPWPIPSKAANAWSVIDDASTDALVYVWVDPSGVVRFADFGAFPAAPFAIGCPVPAPPADDYRSLILATPGLVAYWRMGEAAGLPADEFGSNDATVVGGSPTYGVAGPIAGTDTAIGFDGSSWFIVPDAAGLGLGDAPWSIELWMKRAAFGNNFVPWSKGNQGELIWDPSNRLYLGNQSSANTWTTQAITDTNWHHYVVSRPSNVDGATRVYIDGVDDTATSSGSAYSPNAQPLTFGGRGTLRDLLGQVNPQAPSLGFQGAMDELALYSVALTPAQVLEHYNARTLVPQPPAGTWLQGLSTLTSTFAGDGIRNSVRGQSGDVWTDPIVDAPSQALYGPRPFDVPRMPPDLANWAARILADRANAAYTVALGELRPFDLDELALIIELGLQGASTVRVRDDAHGPLIDYQADIVGAHLTVSSVGWNVQYQTMLSAAAAQTPARTGDED